jgi:hypothetical protein
MSDELTCYSFVKTINELRQEIARLREERGELVEAINGVIEKRGLIQGRYDAGKDPECQPYWDAERKLYEILNKLAMRKQ